ncbi:PH domain-containing protein [Streptomyces sp. A7024]|uniref:PH domain-containing protein n=1 Tax=Streptomyces coryli TaxID=1128680 RepID=A0A6G4TS18_9ACTN|nr:PH domain-containing protein [Streptomyces coryli]NGN62644.1 PH domain-containing protein [Streptomyces coryli]
MTASADDGSGDWRRLDRRTLLVHCQWLGAPLGSIALAALATGGQIPTGSWIALGCIAAAFVAITLGGLVHWARTEFRVDAEALAVRSGLFTRRLRTVPLRRIRSVDLTASPVHRLLGLTVLRAGTAGSGTGLSEMSLNALRVRDAERLRTEILAHVDRSAVADDPLVSRINWRWLRYAPLTFWVIGGVFTVAGAASRILDGAGIQAWRLPFVRRAFSEFGSSMLWLTVPALLLAILVVGSLGALVVYAENWWNYRLEWTDARMLRVRRGLLTTRSVTIERDRLRGAVIREPLLLRAGGGAQVRAVAGGLGNREDNRRRSALLPPAPRGEAVRVAAGALQAPFPEADLIAHPRAALRRRRTRGLVLAVLPGVVALAVLGAVFSSGVLLHAAWVYGLVATLAVLWLARDAYRSLGHTIAGPYLLARSGTFHRDTVALQRESIAAWTFTTSPLGRRAGVVTLTAAVAAGEEGYRIPDADAVEAPSFAAEVSPGIVEEFLEPAPTSSGG